MRVAVKFFISILPVLLCVLLLRVAIQGGALFVGETYDWRIPSATSLLERFGEFTRIRDDILTNISWITDNFTAGSYTWESFPEIVNLATFFQVVGLFFKSVGQFLLGIGSALVLLVHIVVTPIRAVITLLYVVLA